MKLSTLFNLLLAGLMIWLALLPSDIVFDFSGLHALSHLGKWHSLLNPYSNQFVMWRSDALLIKLAQLFSPDETLELGPPIWINLTVFALGFLAEIHFRVREQSLGWKLSTCLIATSLIYILFRFDRQLIEAITWLPWVCFSLTNLSRAQTSPDQIIWGLILLVLSQRLAHSANQIALILLVLAMLVTEIPLLRADARNRLSVIFGLLASIPVVLVLCNAPAPPFPDYPAFAAHVVPYDGVAGWARPFLGGVSPIQIINREAVRERFFRMSLLFAALASVILLLRRFSSLVGFQGKSRDIGVTLFIVISFCLFADLVLPQDLSQIAPLQVLSRIVPNWFYFSLDSLFVFAACWVLVRHLILAGRQLYFSCLILAILGLQFCLPITNSYLSRALGQYISHSNGFQSRSIELERTMLSPSYFVLNYFGPWILSQKEAITALKKFPLTASDVTVVTSLSVSGNSLPQISDSNFETRWSPKVGRQVGDEWIKLAWHSPRKIMGIELSPGRFSSDFPRGVRVSSLETCDPSDNVNKGFQQIVEYRFWQGALKYTDQGFPYFGAQSDVKILFPNPVSVGCLLIQQIGTDQNYDWSVAEVSTLE